MKVTTPLEGAETSRTRTPEAPSNLEESARSFLPAAERVLACSG